MLGYKRNNANNSLRKEAIIMTQNYNVNNSNFIARGMAILPSICL